jgi:outer membrane protein assembly factor BamB
VELGPVYGRPAFAPDGATLYVPSVDHRLYALDPETGRQRFAYDAGVPVLGSPLVREVDGRDVVVVGAGEALHVIDAETGARLWTASDHGAFAGLPASDGVRVYTGGSHGDAYAYEAGTGQVAWSISTNSRITAYTRFIYGPWYDTVELLPGDLVLVSTVADAFALEAATGQIRWSRSGSYIYAPASVLEDGDLLLIDDFGRTASRVDSETGEERWTVNFGVRAINTGAAIHDNLAWIPGTTGLLVAIDLDTGEIRHQLQLTTTANCYSPPVIVDGTLLVGDQDGVLHGIAVG